MKKPFYVTVTETHSRIISIMAEDAREAEEKASKLCDNGAVKLNDNDLDIRSFSSEEAAPAGKSNLIEMFLGTESAAQEHEEETRPSMPYIDAKNLVDTAIQYGILHTEECVAIYRNAGKNPARNPEGWYLEPRESVYETIMRDKEGQDTLINALKEKGVLFRSGAMPQSGAISRVEITPEDLPQNVNGYGHINFHANGSIYAEAHAKETAKAVEMLSKSQRFRLEFMRNYLQEQQDDFNKQLKELLTSMVLQRSTLFSVCKALEKKPQEKTKGKEVIRVVFVNPDTEWEDVTEFDTNDLGEALNLFRGDFCDNNGWDDCPEIIRIESSKTFVSAN